MERHLNVSSSLFVIIVAQEAKIIVTDPYPFAIDEVFDTYRVLVESRGKAIGMSGKNLNVIVSGDSAYVG